MLKNYAMFPFGCGRRLGEELSSILIGICFSHNGINWLLTGFNLRTG